nr:uncharacterized protein DKFZp434B061-like [Camelus dromedarius]
MQPPEGLSGAGGQAPETSPYSTVHRPAPRQAEGATQGVKSRRASSGPSGRPPRPPPGSLVIRKGGREECDSGRDVRRARGDSGTSVVCTLTREAGFSQPADHRPGRRWRGRTGMRAAPLRRAGGGWRCSGSSTNGSEDLRIQWGSPLSREDVAGPSDPWSLSGPPPSAPAPSPVLAHALGPPTAAPVLPQLPSTTTPQPASAASSIRKEAGGG